MRNLLPLAFAAAVAVSGCKEKAPAGEATSPDEKQAIAAADAWLAVVDGERYADSWEQAAAFFKAAVPATTWTQQVSAVRKPLGKLVSRKVKSKVFTTSVPGAPDGKYVVIQYDTSFEHKANAVETVTPMADKDGTWRVSGYYIR